MPYQHVHKNLFLRAEANFENIHQQNKNPKCNESCTYSEIDASQECHWAYTLQQAISHLHHSSTQSN